MPRATKAQIAATESAPEADATDWKPGVALKGRTVERVMVYAEDTGCAIKYKVGTETKTYQMCCLVPDHTARHLGMKQADANKLPEGVTTNIMGSRNGVSIKIPWIENGKPKRSAKGHVHLVSIPVPGNASIRNIVSFLKTECSQNRPTFFITPRGVKRPISYSA